MKKQKKKTVQKFVKKDGICNICQRQVKLSADHVPPKVCPPAKRRIISKLLNEITGDRSFRPRISQSGIQYKTICGECNSSLGSDYDWALGQFSQTVEGFISSSIALPASFEVECCPNAIIRSVLGHLLAAKTEHDDVVIDSLIRPSIRDKSVPIHEDIHVFYWIYPYEKTIILRDFGMPAVRGSFDKPGFFSMMKFYPIAFLVTHQLPEYEGLHSLHQFNGLSVDSKARLTVHLQTIKSPTWPEECLGLDNFLMVGRAAHDSVYSVPNTRILKF